MNQTTHKNRTGSKTKFPSFDSTQQNTHTSVLVLTLTTGTTSPSSSSSWIRFYHKPLSYHSIALAISLNFGYRAYWMMVNVYAVDAASVCTYSSLSLCQPVSVCIFTCLFHQQCNFPLAVHQNSTCLSPTRRSFALIRKLNWIAMTMQTIAQFSQKWWSIVHAREAVCIAAIPTIAKMKLKQWSILIFIFSNTSTSSKTR